MPIREKKVTAEALSNYLAKTTPSRNTSSLKNAKPNLSNPIPDDRVDPTPPATRQTPHEAISNEPSHTKQNTETLSDRLLRLKTKNPKDEKELSTSFLLQKRGGEVDLKSKPFTHIERPDFQRTHHLKESSGETSLNTEMDESVKQENHKRNKIENAIHTVRQESPLKREILDAKATVRHFAQTLQEQVKNYKPPFNRMRLTLDPKELGNVEVTMISRGNQLHIQVHSNPAAIGFMATQGQELKQQLVNIGFTEVQMQFNMNQQRQQQHKTPKTLPQNYREVEEIPDFYESLDLIIPHYV